MQQLIFDLEYDELASRLKEWGYPGYRADQLWQGLYSSLWSDASQFNLPPALRQRLSTHFSFQHLQPITKVESQDGNTHKLLFRLPGNAESSGQAIEAVLMRYEQRNTLCISTQVGCAMGCVFCATGQMGFRGNLSSGQIIEQVLYFARALRANGERPTHIVIMGMGEPFHNYEATLAAVDRLNHPRGFNFGARRFTISTVGLVPMIDRFASERRQVNLAVSLHAADDELRASMLPINRKYPLKVLMEACRNYVRQTGRRITFEWALIQDVNDTDEAAQQLAELLANLNCHVNVIPLNPTREYHGQATTRKRARQFCAILNAHNIPCTIRLRRGIDINAGCGQLALQDHA